ncbi:precorrin-6A reductase [Natroniella sulfidigena]|uniref:precorrin-6A reductase n=1 Tax=Natroniella sulfidigena TaxID=723921 RepID=UPI00200A9EC0|nr:precorrin-6A reductase [Natroniella sulfidigena]MCK8817373.1 precorrin-6A reductase [Natroniella sulfidigena]
MILVLAGTKDSRQIIKSLKEAGKELIASVVTDYGYQLVSQLGVEVIQERLDKKAMAELIKKRGIDLVIDATHPFAEEVSKIAIGLCNNLEVDYLRFEREEIEVPKQELIIEVNNYREAARRANDFERVLLTIGSRRLNYFVEEVDNWEERLVARILPTWQFVKQAQELGFTPQNLIGMQGPFSKELNQAILKRYDISALVTKASGKTGGLGTKLEAALDLGIPVILITRPQLPTDKIVTDYQKLLGEIADE